MSRELEEFLGLINQAKKSETGYVDLTPAKEYLKNPKRSTEFMEEFLNLDLGYDSREFNITLPENPSVTKSIIATLVTKAAHRWEWRALSGFYAKQLEIAGLELKWDYPNYLIGEESSDLERAPLNVYSVMRYIAEDLWNDLGDQGSLHLTYVPDNVDGDHFGPASISESCTEYLLSPGFECQWINLTRGIVIDRVLESVEENWVFEEDWADDLSNEWNRVAVLLNGLASGEIENYNEKLVGEYIEAYADSDYYYETDMELLEFTYEGLRYKNLNQAQQMVLVSNLVLAHRNDMFLRHFGLTSHLLNLISIHPNTGGEVLEKIFSDEDETISRGKKLRDITSGGGSI
jgi:hypothetical protein